MKSLTFFLPTYRTQASTGLDGSICTGVIRVRLRVRRMGRDDGLDGILEFIICLDLSGVKTESGSMLLIRPYCIYLCICSLDE